MPVASQQRQEASHFCYSRVSLESEESGMLLLKHNLIFKYFNHIFWQIQQSLELDYVMKSLSQQREQDIAFWTDFPPLRHQEIDVYL